jgi:hypothetical protein
MKLCETEVVSDPFASREEVEKWYDKYYQSKVNEFMEIHR